MLLYHRFFYYKGHLLLYFMSFLVLSCLVLIQGWNNQARALLLDSVSIEEGFLLSVCWPPVKLCKVWDMKNMMESFERVDRVAKVAKLASEIFHGSPKKPDWVQKLLIEALKDWKGLKNCQRRDWVQKLSRKALLYKIAFRNCFIEP